VLDRHWVLNLSDLNPGATLEMCKQLAALTRRKAMHLKDILDRPEGLESAAVRRIRNHKKRGPARAPGDTGLHVARIKGKYFYWFGMASRTHIHCPFFGHWMDRSTKTL
jgi:hypothetical protein